MEVILTFTFGTLVFLGSVFVYFIPSLIARKKEHVHFVPILILNLFLGWSVLGWFAALIWVFTKTSK